MSGYLPKLNVIQQNMSYIREFRGLNHNPVISENEMYDCTNMSSDDYPMLAPRKKRALCRETNGNFNGIIAHDKLLWVEGTNLIYDGETVGEVSDSPKQFVLMGAYVIIFPDKLMYNTHTNTLEEMEIDIPAGACNVRATPSTKKYVDYSFRGPNTTGSSYVAQNGDYWFDTSGETYVTRMYSATLGVWVEQPSYVMVTFWLHDTDSVDIQKGDSISFTFNGTYTDNNLEDTADLADLNGEHIIENIEIIPNGPDVTVNLWIQGHLRDIEAYGGDGSKTVALKRELPEMDFVCESGNRLYGCSSKNHEVYASSLGRPQNWKTYQGLSTDSYAATIGSPGEFTGIAPFRDNVVFFKENRMHILYGTMPSKYQLDELACFGVEKGAANSIQNVSEALYYKSQNAFCRYDGASLPEVISDNLGDITGMKTVCSGAVGSKYYVQTDLYGTKALYVLDTRKGMWHKEDNVNIMHFATHDGKMYFASDIAGNGIYKIDAAYPVQTWENNVVVEGTGTYRRMEWSATSGLVGLDHPYSKHIQKLVIRVNMGRGSLIRVAVAYDNEEFKEVYRKSSVKNQSLSIELVPHRCDTMRIRMSGYGDVRVFSIAKITEEGQDSVKA